jgi:hypothetical protein
LVVFFQVGIFIASSVSTKINKKGDNMKKSFVFLALTFVLAIGLSAATFEGTWDLYFDWGCDNNYSSTAVTINSDGTFTCGTSMSGEWFETDDCKIIFQFSNGTTYSGTKVGRAMLGMMATTWSTLRGCWYAVRRHDNPQAISVELYPKKVDGSSSTIPHKKN